MTFLFCMMVLALCCTTVKTFFKYLFLCRGDVRRNGGCVCPRTEPLPTSVYLPHHLHWTQVSVCCHQIQQKNDNTS